MYQFSAISRIILFAGVFLLFTIGGTETAIGQPFTSGLDVTTNIDRPKDVSTADIDGDGDADVLSASEFDDMIAWYRNGDSSGGGDGSSWKQNEITSDATGAQSVYAADLDGDGDQDVIAAADTIAWYRNGDSNGGGDGSSWTRIDITVTADGGQSVYVADVDGDGDKDVVSASSGDDTIAWYRNGDSSGSGDGSSWTRTDITTSADAAQSVYAADIDGDGDADVLSASFRDDTVAWYRNGDSSGGGDGSSWTRTDITTSAIEAKDVYAADIDGDGDIDAISASEGDDTIAWYRNGDSSGSGDGSSWTRTDITTSADAAQSVYAADIDGDGDADVLSASFRDDTVAWYQNGDSNGSGDGSSWAVTDITTTFNRPVSVYAADIDGDSDQDALSVSQYNDTVKLYENARLTGNDPVVYVDPDAGGTADGSSWEDAHLTVQDALANLPSGPVEIWIASGTYFPDEGAGQSQNDRSASFAIPNYVRLYGGFDGTDGSGGGAQETDRDQRNSDPATNNTVLTGDLGTTDFPNDNAYHVVTVASGADVAVDGVTIRDGNASGFDPDNSGGGIWAKSNSSLRLRNARLQANQASSNGGGLYSQGTVTVKETILSDNSASSSGGGIFSEGSSHTFSGVTALNNTGGGIITTGGKNSFVDVTANDNDGGGIISGGMFTNIEVKRNSSDIGGGIKINSNSTLSEVTVSENDALQSGGGLYSDGADVDIIEATFAGNTAEDHGGGIYLLNASLRTTNASFYGNVQTDTNFDGGGLYLANVGGSLTNVVLSGNSAAGDGGALYISPDGNVPIINMTAANNSADREGGALYTTSSNSNDFPALRNSIVWGNTSMSSGDAQQVYIASGDLPVEHSIIQGGVPNGAFDGGGNLDQDPQFADSTGTDDIVGTADDDLRLQGPGSGGDPSPAIEAGDSGLLPSDVLDVDNNGDTSELLPLDRAGNARERDVGEVSGTGVDMGAYESTGDPLPVELVTFDVNQQSDATLLTWRTVSEQNNAGFEVQRRVSSEWVTLSFVEGAGTTSEPQTYRYSDTDLPYEADSVKYRLKQVDIDGTTTLSEVRTLNVGTPEELSLHAPFPNPARGQVTLRYALPSKTDVSIRVYDLLGRRVATLQRGPQDAGRKEVQISTSDLSSGTYFVRLQAGEKLKTKRLTVVR